MNESKTSNDEIKVTDDMIDRFTVKLLASKGQFIMTRRNIRAALKAALNGK